MEKIKITNRSAEDGVKISKMKRKLKVKDLIQELLKMPNDADVILYKSHYSSFSENILVHTSDDGKNVFIEG